jgi:Domain of unknown function (DUF3854)
LPGPLSPRPPTTKKGASLAMLADDNPRPARESTRKGVLSGAHHRQLEGGSAISPEVIAERGVRSITGGRELPKGFSRRQRRRGGGILFIAHRPNGQTGYSFRPDALDPESPGRRYEQPCKAYGGPGNILDLHPSVRHLIADKSVPVIFVEGIKKADAIISAAKREGAEVLVVAIFGVWNWLSDGEPIPDMFDIPVEGRKVTICFDSDMLRNPNVQDAAHRLAGHLIKRGAEVWITYLPDQADGSKVGADDFFAGGGTLAELRMLTRRYDPSDFVRVRLSRSARLRLALEDLERRFWAEEWKGIGGHSERDVALKLIEAARRHGTVVTGGIRVVKSWGSLQIEAKVSPRTLSKALSRLEDRGFVGERVKADKADKAGGFVLRADVYHYGTERGPEQNATHPLQAAHDGTIHLRAPRLRWSSPGSKPRRGTVKGTRMVRKSIRRPPRDPIRRLGKIRGHIIDVLEAAGGTLSLQELAAAMHKARPRELVRAKTKASPGGRNGPVIMLLQAGIVEWACDVGTRQEVLRLTPNWREALENARELGKEVEADELAARALERKRTAYHNRHQRPADEAPAEGEMQERREARPKERQAAIRDALARLFAERPEYRTRRAGQITCALINYIGPDFPRGQDGAPKDAEVEAILEGAAA